MRKHSTYNRNNFSEKETNGKKQVESKKFTTKLMHLSKKEGGGNLPNVEGKRIKQGVDHDRT